MALVQPSKTEAAFVLIADVTGHLNETNALLEKIHKNLTTVDQAKRSTAEAHGSKITVYDIPKHDDHAARRAVYCLREEVLIATDNLHVLEGILGRFSGRGTDSLAALPAFSGVMARCQADAGNLEPEVRWFIEPFGYIEAARIASPPAHRRKGTDMVKIFKEQGFTAIQGVGGFVNLVIGKYELLHRTAVSAPPVKPGDDHYELAANILDFPNGGDFEPQAWVPREVASYASFNLKPQKAFEASKTLVNAIVGDDVFEDVLKSIEEDPNGPQINIRRDLIAELGQRATIVSDYLLPITPKSERMLFAIEVKNPAQLAAAIDKSMKTDPQARRHEFGEHIIWEIVDEETTLPMITIENNPALAPGRGEEEEEEPKERMLPSVAVTVAYGHLFVATHYDFMTKILTPSAESHQLVNSIDYQLVRDELTQLAAGKLLCARTFARTDEEYRAVYELIRAGRMPESESLLGKLLNAVLGEGKEGVPRAPRIDGSKLPDYEAVRRYFGPAGIWGTSEPNGWFLTGFTLSKDVE